MCQPSTRSWARGIGQELGLLALFVSAGKLGKQLLGSWSLLHFGLVSAKRHAKLWELRCLV